jgi:hypothetical protein
MVQCSHPDPPDPTDLDASTYFFPPGAIIYIEGTMHSNFCVTDLERLSCRDKSQFGTTQRVTDA